MIKSASMYSAIGQILTPDVRLGSKGRPIIDIAASRPLISNLVVTVAFLTSTALARVQPFPLGFKAQTISTNGAKVHLRMGVWEQGLCSHVAAWLRRKLALARQSCQRLRRRADVRVSDFLCGRPTVRRHHCAECGFAIVDEF
jgi:hypothetical protein